MGEQELLSQEEIDALLAMLPEEEVSPAAVESKQEAGAEVTEMVTEAAVESMGPVAPSRLPPETARRYDFRRPDKFSKEQVRTLRMMHESMARRLALSLSAHLRAAVDVTLADIDQGIYATFIQQTPTPAVFHVVSMKPLPGHIIFYTSLGLAHMMVDRMLGGPGRPLEMTREVTDLELNLINGAVNKLLEALQEAWGGVIQLRPRIEETALNLYFVNIALPSDPTVWVVFEVRIKNGTGTIAMGIPYSVLKPISGRLSPQTWIASAEPRASENDEESGYLLKNLQHVRLPLIVELGTTEITVQELLELQKGDVLILDTGVKADLKIMVNRRLKFKGKPGRRGTRLAVQITKVIDDPTAA